MWWCSVWLCSAGMGLSWVMVQDAGLGMITGVHTKYTMPFPVCTDACVATL